MAITRWSPLRDIELWRPLHEIESMRHEMDRLFERLMPTGDRDLTEFGFVPPVEMQETDDTIDVRLEIPGLEAKDLDIDVGEEAIAITGERKSETKTEEKGEVRSEFRYGKFVRKVTLPARIKAEEVKAEYKNGILHMTLPKAEVEKRVHVKVEVAE